MRYIGKGEIDSLEDRIDADVDKKMWKRLNDATWNGISNYVYIKIGYRTRGAVFYEVKERL